MTDPQQPQVGGWLPPAQANYQRPPKRSAIPMVIGILMIIFGGFGILGGLFNLAGGNAMFDNPALRDPDIGGKFAKVMEDMETFTRSTAVISLIMAVFQLWVGILAIKYKRNAPTMAKAYGITAIVEVLGTLVLFYAWLAPALQDAPPIIRGAMGFGFIIGAIIGVAWPVIILALMTRPAARAACAS